jgi:hypothetical protein
MVWISTGWQLGCNDSNHWWSGSLCHGLCYWSSKGVAQAYLSRYEDEYGIVQQKELPRPAVAHFLYDFLPLIDEHNKARQSALALEKKWLTKCSWTRILTTLLGMAIVDLQRWDRRKQHHNNLRAVDFAPMDKEAGDNDEILVDDFDIRRLCNLISKPLRSGAF